MNKFLMSAAAIALLFSAQAFAEEGQSGDHKGPPGGGRAVERFQEADSNGDGYLTKEEMLKAHEKRLDKMFERVDADKDNKLSKEELKKGREDMRAKFKDRFKDRKAGGDVKSDDAKGDDGKDDAPPADAPPPENE